MFPEKNHNYPEGYEKTPWCPNSKLVEICNSLAGLEPNPEYFCTNDIENAVWSGGALNYLKSGDFVPNTSCHRANLELHRQMVIIKSDTPPPPTNDEMRLKLEKVENREGMSEIFESYRIVKGRYDEKTKILTRWRTVVFEACCSTTVDKKNDHFRQFSSADELSEGEIVNTVEHFKEALEKIIGYKEGTAGYWIGGALNCPQSPRHYHFGPMID